MPKTRKKLVLLDSHAIIHRAYHALPDFATSKGEPTGAIYGLVTMLIKMIQDLKPDYIAAALDLEGPTHRHIAYESYKAGRSKTEDALIIQLNRAKDIFRAFGIPIYSHEGFEADDIIGTIVSELKKDKTTDIIIVTGDADALQLVQGNKVQAYMPKRTLNDTALYDEEGVKAKYGFGPEHLTDYKGLRGDPSDNIPGVKGIGEKTATILIQAFGSVENIYKNLAKAPVTDRIKELLKESKEEALFSKTLATIRTDAPVHFKLGDTWKDCIDLEKIDKLFLELEFRNLGERVRKLVGEPEAKKEKFEVNPAIEKELGIMLWVIDSNFTNPNIEDVFRFTKTKDLKKAREVLEEELDKRKVRKVYEDIEKPLIPVTDEMYKRGIKVDRDKLIELSKTYHKELNKLEKKIWEYAGEEFNINSPKVLSDILFKKLNLGESRQKKTPTGALSTKESELEKLRDKHPIVGLVLEYRELGKLLSTYIDAIPPQLDAEGRLHSTFVQAGAATGRMASHNPNLQNIPIKTELGRAIRHAFVAEEGFELVALDYSQIELRIAAILSGDKNLIEIFKSGRDVHTEVASRVFRVPPEEVDKEMRRKAKVINFGILYGMGVNALKVNLRTDRKDAQEFYNQYFATFTELASYLDRVKASAERTGFTETIFGRRRYFTGFKSPLPYVRAQAERMAINAPIQGTQADIIKIAMKKIDEQIKKGKNEDNMRMLLQVHDELIFEVKEDLIAEAKKDFKKIMESILPEKERKGVPIIAEAHTGKNWGTME